MLHRIYTDSEFTDYLNRYMEGIIFMKNTLSKVRMGYELSEAFSNHACRFFIDVAFTDFDALKEDEKRFGHKYIFIIILIIQAVSLFHSVTSHKETIL